MNVGVQKKVGDQAAPLACQGDDRHFAVVRGFNGVHDVVRIAAGRDGDQNVAGLAQRFDLAPEDSFVSVVIADGGQNGGICVQGDARQGQTLAFKAADQFSDEVLGVGRRAAV